MLVAEQLGEVPVCTPIDSHAWLTIGVAEAGVRGICCENWMTTKLGGYRAMQNDPDAPTNAQVNMYAAFAHTIRESAGTYSRIEFPLEQEAYPLLMYPE